MCEGSRNTILATKVPRSDGRDRRVEWRITRFERDGPHLWSPLARNLADRPPFSTRRSDTRSALSVTNRSAIEAILSSELLHSAWSDFYCSINPSLFHSMITNFLCVVMAARTDSSLLTVVLKDLLQYCNFTSSATAHGVQYPGGS